MSHVIPMSLLKAVLRPEKLLIVKIIDNLVVREKRRIVDHTTNSIGQKYRLVFANISLHKLTFTDKRFNNPKIAAFLLTFECFIHIRIIDP